MSDAGMGFLNAFTAARRHKLDKARQEADLENSKQERELRGIQIEEAKRNRDLAAARRNDLTSSLTPPSALPDGQPRPAPRPFEAMESAANKRLAAGDLDGYNDLVGKAAATKTLYYTTAFSNAYRSGDKSGLLAIINEFPNGQKYELEDAEDGSLVMKGFAGDGRPVGVRQYKNLDEWFADMQSRVNPGDIAKTIREKIEFDTKQKFTQAQTSQVEANTKTENDTRQGKVDAQAANVEQSKAAAQASRASAANAGTTSEIRNFGFRSKLSPEQQTAFDAGTGAADRVAQRRSQSILAQATKLAQMHNSVVANMGNQKTPDDFLDQAAVNVDAAEASAGARRSPVGKPGPRPENLPVASPKSKAEFDSLPKGAVFTAPDGTVRIKP